MKIIDPHIHLFDRENGDYHWLAQGNPPHWPRKHVLQTSFSEADLNLDAAKRLAGIVHIEAGYDNQCAWREIDWLEGSVSLALRTIACADLNQRENEFEHNVRVLAERESCVGVRHIMDQQASTLLKNKLCLHNLSQLAKHDMLFELQFNVADTPAVNALLNYYEHSQSIPRIVINHLGMPRYNAQNDADWLHNLKRLSALPNIFIKISGWEMSEHKVGMEQIEMYVHSVFEYWDKTRIMMASNFPVCLMRTSYAQQWQELIDLSDLHKHAFCYQNAHSCYRF